MTAQPGQVLVERGPQLERLRTLGARARAGRGGCALVGGPVAVGKSALLHAFAEQFDAEGGTVLRATASAEERALPLAVLDQLLRRAPRPTGLRDTADGLLGSLLPPCSSETGQDARRAAVEAAVRGLGTALLDAAERQPLALVVDDLHLADPDSLVCLSWLARRLDSAGLALAFAAGDAVPSPFASFRTSLLRLPGTLRLRLLPLSPDGTAELMAELTAELTARRTAGPQEAHAATGGNPLLTRVLPADVGETAGEAAWPGRGYQEAVRELLHRCGPETTAVAQGLAVLGVPHGVERLLDVPAGTVARALDELTACGLLLAGGYRHPAARDATLVGIDPELRAELHARAAVLVRGDGATPGEVAGHLLAAGRPGPTWAAELLEQAALDALTEGRVGAAVDCLKLACRSSTDVEQLARLGTELVRAEWRIDPGTPARRLPGLLELQGDGHLRGSDALVLARALLWHGRLADAREVLARISADPDAHDDPEHAVELRTTLSWLRWSFAPLLPAAPPLETTAEEDARTARISHRLAAAATLDAVLGNGPAAGPTAEAERILRGTRLVDMGMDTAESALLALTYGEQAGLAAPWCDRLIGDAVAGQAPSRQARLRGLRADISLRQGDLPGAVAQARAALAALPAAGWGVAVGAVLAALVQALTAMGRLDAAAEELGRPVPEAMLQSRFGLLYLQARGRHRLETGHPEAAAADFRLCGDLMREWGVDAPGLIAWRGDLGEARLALGAPEEARALAREQLDRSGERLPRAHGIALRLLAATHEPPQRAPLLRQSVDALRGSGDRYELARSLTALARAHQLLGDVRRAALVAREAKGSAESCGADPLLAQLRRISGSGGTGPVLDDGVGAVDGPPRATTGPLSEDERRVAELAALGYTNREICQRLYVTVSTVEQRLTRAYRKLGIGSRAELPAVLV